MMSETNRGPAPALEVRHLRAIDAIEREGTVTAAAGRLHLTQSAVSHIVRDMETRLGVQLFRRDRGMELTPEGERLLLTARRVLGEIEHGEREVAELRDGHRGVLRLTTECYTCYHWLPAILRRFAEEHPGIDLQIVPEAIARPIEALMQDELDVALVHQPPDPGSGIETVPLFEDEVVAVVPPGHTLAERPHLAPEDFRDQVIVLHFDPGESLFVRTFLRPAGVVPRRYLELQLSEAVIESVKAGLGVSAMARWAVAPHVDAGELVEIRLGEDGLRREWHAALSGRRSGWPPVRALVRLLERDALGAAGRCALGVTGDR